MASMPLSNQQLAALFNLDDTIGAALIGMVVSALLFGLSNLQVYIYYQQFPGDLIVYRIFVAFIWILDAVNLAMTIHAIYYYLVSNFGNYLALSGVVWSFKVQVTTNVIIIVMVQSLYSLRLWKLNNRNSILPRIVPFTIILGAGIGAALAVETWKLDFFADLENMKWATYGSFSIVVVIDFAIAGTMCYYLYQSRSEFAATNSKLSALILWVLSTGLVTSVCSLVGLITSVTMPKSFIFLAFEFLLTKLYFNSFLAMLNARRSIKNKGASDSFSTNFSQPRSQLSSPRTPLPYCEDKFSMRLDDISDPGFSFVKVQSPHFNHRLMRNQEQMQAHDSHDESQEVYAENVGTAV